VSHRIGLSNQAADILFDEVAHVLGEVFPIHERGGEHAFAEACAELRQFFAIARKLGDDLNIVLARRFHFVAALYERRFASQRRSETAATACFKTCRPSPLLWLLPIQLILFPHILGRG